MFYSSSFLVDASLLTLILLFNRLCVENYYLILKGENETKVKRYIYFGIFPKLSASRLAMPIPDPFGFAID